MTCDDSDGDGSPASTFRWACPICGKSGVVEAEDHGEAREPLIRHLRYTEGDGHEEHDTIPESMDIYSMDDHIDRAG